MKIQYSRRRRTGLLAAAIAFVGGALLAAPTAPAASAAAPSTTAGSQPDPATVATALERRLGSRTAGSYLDQSSGRLVVTVTNTADARTVRAAGAIPRFVTRNGAQLARITAALDRSTRVVGTAWAVDPRSNQVVVSLDSSVTGAKLARMKAVTQRFGAAVRVEKVPGRFRTLIRGGDAIYGGNSRCSLGFNVRSGTTYFFLTAGHCGNIASSWYANSSHTIFLGTRRGSSFPGNDYAIIRHENSNVSHPGTVNLYNGSSQDITTAGNAYVGQRVRRSGSTTGVRSGTVQALNQTVRYLQGTVYGLIKTNACAEPGDSGGPLFANTTALGLLSGGSGNCFFGGTTFYQPVTEPLSVYGVNVY